MGKSIRSIVLTAGCLMAFAVLGKSHSIDLRQSMARPKTNIKMMATALAASSPEAGEGVLRTTDLDVGAADVGEVAVGDELVFTLFDDVRITLSLKKQMPSPLGGDVFLAEANGYDGVRNAVVLRTADGLTIDVQDYINKKVYKVLSTPAGVTVQETEARGGGTCGCDTLEPPLPQAAPAVSAARQAPRLMSSSGQGDTCVDILVAYDNNAATWADKNGGITNFAQLAVQKMNYVISNTGLDEQFWFRLVGVVRLSVSTDNLNTALDSATEGTGGWAAVKAKRDEVGADIVTVLIDTGSAYGTTGLGWSLKTENFAFFSENAYNACAVRSVAQSHTMTHEVGHNMGCGHSDVQSSSPGPQLYKYSAGYYFSAGGAKYHTIMAYGGEGPGGTEVPYFSSPDYSYKSVAVGDASHDNAQTLSRTFAGVAQWRDAKGSEIGGGATSEPLAWETSRSTAFSRARAQGKKVFLISGRDDCPNTTATRSFSCEDPSVKRYLQNDYICWYNDCDEQYEEAYKYFSRGDVGYTLPFIAVIDAASDRALAAEGGYHSASDLCLMLERVANGIVFPEPLKWHTSGSSAIAEAKRDNKMILFIGGRETCGNTIGTRDFTCEEAEVRMALGDYVLWFCDCDRQTDVFWQYGSGLGSVTLPLVCVISPYDSKTYVARKTGYQDASGMLSLLRAAGPKTVTFNANGGVVGEQERRVLPKAAVGKLPTPKRGKYTFLGWYTKKSGGTKISASTKIKANVTYYAHWAAPWTVTFNPNGGSLNGVTNKVIVARGKAVGTLPSPTKEGYALKGWYTKKSGGAKISASAKVTKNVTYYAQWTPRKYAVKVIKDGNGSVSGTGSKAYQSKVTLKANAASGYVFQGWYKTVNSEEGIVNSGVQVSQKTTLSFKVPLGGVTYLAKFITKAEDKDGIGMEFDGFGFGAMEDDGGLGETALPVVTNTCGVVTTWPIGAIGLTPVSVSVTGQPKGMTYDAKKKAVTGVPSAANTSGTMKITVKSAGASRSWTVMWHMVELPAFARGTFCGWTYEQMGNGEWETGNAVRKVTVSVTSAGKITAKVGSLTLARTGWTAGEDGFYHATLSATRTVGTGKKAKKYKDVVALVLDPDAEWTEDQLTGTVRSYLTTDLNTPLNADAVASARRSPYGDNAEAKEALAAIRASAPASFTGNDGTAWKFSVSDNGVVTISRTTGSGKNKKTVSATSVVEIVRDGDGYAARVRFLISGTIAEMTW